MKYDQAFFDTYIERRGTRNIKWDGCNAKFGVDMGTWFGLGGDGFLRFNLACPRCLLEKAMEMLTKALNDL